MKKIIAEAGYLSIIRTLSQVIFLSINAVIVSFLGLKAFGIYIAIVGTIEILVVALSCGLQNSNVIIMAKVKSTANKLMINTVLWCVFVWVLSQVLFTIFYQYGLLPNFVSDLSSSGTSLLLHLKIYLGVKLLLYTMLPSLRSLGFILFGAGLELLQNFLTLMTTVVFFVTGWDGLPMVIIANYFSGLLCLCILGVKFLLVRTSGKISYLTHGRLFVFQISRGMKLMPGSLMQTFYYRYPLLYLQSLNFGSIGPAEYSLAYLVCSKLNIFSQSVIPFFQVFAAKNSNKISSAHIVSKLVLASVLAGILVSIFIVTFLNDMLAILGEELYLSRLLLALLCASAIFLGSARIYATYLTSRGFPLINTIGSFISFAFLFVNIHFLFKVDTSAGMATNFLFSSVVLCGFYRYFVFIDSKKNMATRKITK